MGAGDEKIDSYVPQIFNPVDKIILSVYFFTACFYKN